jgi:hypothetical protein
LNTAILAGLTVSVSLAVGGCAAGTPAAAPASAATVTAVATVPGPATVPPGTVLLRKSGTGNWQSPLFTVGTGTPILKVVYRFSGNTAAGMPAVFSAEIDSAADTHLFVSEIADAGGPATTTVTPSVQAGDRAYYLLVSAAGPWSFTVTEIN